jgi:hypothetical protein
VLAVISGERPLGARGRVRLGGGQVVPGRGQAARDPVEHQQAATPALPGRRGHGVVVRGEAGTVGAARHPGGPGQPGVECPPGRPEVLGRDDESSHRRPDVLKVRLDPSTALAAAVARRHRVHDDRRRRDLCPPDRDVGRSGSQVVAPGGVDERREQAQRV